MALMEDKIKNVRNQVMNYVSAYPDKFDDMDVEHIKNKDWIIERYVMDNNCKNFIVNYMLNVLYEKLSHMKLQTTNKRPGIK